MEPKILIVDDDLDTLRLVGIMLEKYGYRIAAASSGSQAIAAAKNEMPDLILLDLMMPDMDGYEVTRLIRADKQMHHVPIIMFTAKSQVEDKVLGYEAGIDGYLTKPIHPAELAANVRSALARQSKIIQTVSKPKGRVIGVISTRGGIGTTTLAVNTAIALRKTGHFSVTLAELRPSQGTLAEDLDLPGNMGLCNLAQLKAEAITEKDVEKELSIHLSGVKVLSAPNKPSSLQLAGETDSLIQIVKHLSVLSEFIILDLGMNILTGFDSYLDLFDEVILTFEPMPSAIKRTRMMLKLLMEKGFGQSRPLDLVMITRLRSELQYTRNQMQEYLETPINLVVSPVPEMAYQSEVQKVPIIDLDTSNLASQQYKAIAEVLIKHRDDEKGSER